MKRMKKKKNEKLERELMFNEDNKKMKINKKKKKANNNNQENIFKNSDEYIDLEGLNKEQIKKLNEEYVILGLDPGRKSLCTIVDNNKKIFQYNACNRRHKTYAKFQYKIQKKIRKEDNIDMYESFISNNSCRTLNSREYYNFIKTKNSISEVIKDFYNKKVHRNLRFRMYCRTKKSESELLNEIEKTFNEGDKKIAIGYGNWSMNSQMKNFFSTPNQGFRKLIHSRFLTITIDEFRTSCRYYKTGEELENFEYSKNENKVKCHKLLKTSVNTNPTGENQCIYIDRDRNGGKNILQCFINKLSNKSRPLFLQRSS